MKTGSLVRALVTAAILLFLPKATQAGFIITTSTSWDGDSGISSFGEDRGSGIITTFGQTFTATSETTLRNFSFWLRLNSTSDPSHFIAYLSEWTGSSLNGPLLYQSAPISVTSTSFSEFRFDVGSIELVEGRQYLALLSASSLFDGVEDSVAAGFLGRNVYLGAGFGGFDQGGGFVANDNRGNFNSLYSPSSGWISTPQDLAFRAEFEISTPAPVAVPEPPMGPPLMLLLVAAIVRSTWRRSATVASAGQRGTPDGNVEVL